MEMVMYNKRLAEEKKRKEKDLKDAEQKANLAEIEGQLNDPYMKEDKSLAASETGRMQTDNFKGMGQEAVQAMCEENKRLADEKNRLLRVSSHEIIRLRLFCMAALETSLLPSIYLDSVGGDFFVL